MTTKEFREILKSKPESEMDAQFFSIFLSVISWAKIGIPCIGFSKTSMRML